MGSMLPIWIPGFRPMNTGAAAGTPEWTEGQGVDVSTDKMNMVSYPPYTTAHGALDRQTDTYPCCISIPVCSWPKLQVGRVVFENN